MDRIISTLISIVAAVGGSAGLFIGANKLFDLARSRWDVFGVVAGGLLGFLVGLMMWANNVVTFVEGPIVGSPEPLGFTAVIDFLLMVVANTIVPIVIAAVGGWFLTKASSDDPAEAASLQTRRLIIAVATTGLMGLVFGLFYELPMVPAFEPGTTIVWTVVGLAIAGGAWALRRGKSSLASMLALGGGIGWLLGTLVAPGLGDFKRGMIMGLDSDQMWTILSVTIGFALIGAWIGLKPVPDYEARDGVSRKSRVYIFLGPSLLFIFASLVLPALRTVWLSFLGLDDTLPFTERAAGGVDKFVGFDNYKKVFDNPKNFNLDDWANVFGSVLFWGALVLIAVGVIVGIVLGRRRGLSFESSGGSLTPLVLGGFLLMNAIFASFRGTIFNNLWWVVMVVSLATSMGLAIAVLADRAKMENVAKSLIFMPMAISFVGAGIIWRFVYNARDTSQDQTGVLNSIWVALGQLSNSGWPKVVASLILLALVAGLLYLAWRGYKAEAYGLTIGSAVAAIPILWILIRLVTIGIGGFSVAADGSIIEETILVRETSPFNNVYLMVVLIWIQTGFTMVIFSAAIKAVPADLIEASKVDGATESQTFWRVTIPQIAPTIGVVITTLIVLVMKVFDIVKVMTNGNFDTQVLANAMFTEAFNNFQFGTGSALAVLIFLSVLPVMYINIRRMQKEAGH
ncbi:MAG: sugar ABC transporter permease [bacterium]|nr:sugar ABC transporter permease [bacterium]